LNFYAKKPSTCKNSQRKSSKNRRQKENHFDTSTIRTDTIWKHFRRISLVVLVRLVFYYYKEKIAAKGATRLLSQIGIQISKFITFRVYRPVWRLIEAFVERQVFTETFKGIVEIPRFCLIFTIHEVCLIFAF